MAKTPTAADAQVILQLYDLRREAELRKARNWVIGQFWPGNVDDYMKVAGAMGTQENAWLRQVTGYWEMAASLANHGAVSTELFLEPSFCGEMVLIFAKINPMLKELRVKASPTFFKNVEQLIHSSKKGKDILKRMEANVANRRNAMAAGAKAS